MNDDQIEVESLAAKAREMLKNGREMNDIVQLFHDAGVSKRIAVKGKGVSTL